MVLNRVNLDRFAVGLPDPQEAKVAALCAACGGELYEGDLAYHYDGNVYCSESCVVRGLGVDYMEVA